MVQNEMNAVEQDLLSYPKNCQHKLIEVVAEQRKTLLNQLSRLVDRQQVSEVAFEALNALIFTKSPDNLELFARAKWATKEQISLWAFGFVIPPVPKRLTLVHAASEIIYKFPEVIQSIVIGYTGTTPVHSSLTLNHYSQSLVELNGYDSLPHKVRSRFMEDSILTYGDLAMLSLQNVRNFPGIGPANQGAIEEFLIWVDLELRKSNKDPLPFPVFAYNAAKMRGLVT